MNRRLKWIAVGIFVSVFIFFGAGLWFASNQLLFPIWRGVTKDLSVCSPETAKYWGAGCGDLRTTHEFKFREVNFSSVNGYELPGWLIGTAENGKGRAKGAIMLIPAGGSDRREETKFIQFFLGQNLDVLALDLGCQGEAPCPVPGMTEMPKLTAAIAENPMVSFQQLIKDARESQSMPGWAIDLLIKVAMFRGRFDGLISPQHSLRFTKSTPIYFIHSKMDEIVSYTQTQELADLYAGPKTVWFPEKGSHAAIWDVDHADYEKRLSDFLNRIH